jgi:hypothetical protein
VGTSCFGVKTEIPKRERNALAKTLVIKGPDMGNEIHKGPMYCPYCDYGFDNYSCICHLINIKSEVKSLPDNTAFETLLGRYWDIAYTEGCGKVPEEDPNEILYKLRGLLKRPATPSHADMLSIPLSDGTRLCIGDHFSV